MVGITLFHELALVVRSRKAEGILDSRIDHLLDIETEENALLLLEIIFDFYSDGDLAARELNKFLNEEEVNYRKVTDYVMLMDGSAMGVGGARLVHACGELRRFCNERNKDRCLAVLERVKNEHTILRDSLDRIAQIVRHLLINGVLERRR